LLSNVGNTVRVAEFPLTTLNNKPVSRRIGRDRSYLASVQTNTSQTFQNTTLTPGVIRDGFSIQVTPRILGDGRILLQYSLSLIDIVRIRDFTSGGNSVQLPETSSRVFVQQSMLRSGATLILAGFNQDQVEQTSSGVGNPYNYALGGGVANSKTRQTLFIAMTPQEISLPRTENESWPFRVLSKLDGAITQLVCTGNLVRQDGLRRLRVKLRSNLGSKQIFIAFVRPVKMLPFRNMV
jgi:hypothetical protein